jgi:hypothetical protein
VLLLLSPAQNSKPLVRAGRWGSDLSLRDFLIAAHAPLFPAALCGMDGSYEKRDAAISVPHCAALKCATDAVAVQPAAPRIDKRMVGTPPAIDASE